MLKITPSKNFSKIANKQTGRWLWYFACRFFVNGFNVLSFPFRRNTPVRRAWFYARRVEMQSFFLSIFSSIWMEYGKIWTRKNSAFGLLLYNVIKDCLWWFTYIFIIGILMFSYLCVLFESKFWMIFPISSTENVTIDNRLSVIYLTLVGRKLLLEIREDCLKKKKLKSPGFLWNLLWSGFYKTIEM